MPASWTDVGPKDPFVEQSCGRAVARTEDPAGLVKVVGKLVKEIRPQCVNEIRPKYSKTQALKRVPRSGSRGKLGGLGLTDGISHANIRRNYIYIYAATFSIPN